jgi:hypothetical protein
MTRTDRRHQVLSSRWGFVVAIVLAIALESCGGGQAPATASATLDTDGGEVQLESFLLRVYGEVIPDGETPTVTLIRRGALQDELARFHPPEGYRAVGPAVEVQLPFESDLPSELEISYDPSALPEGFEAEDLTIFVYGPTTFDPAPGTSPELLELPEEDLAPIYTEVDSEALTATANVYRAGTYQLVALSDPMEWDIGAAVEDSSEDTGLVQSRREAIQLGLGPIVTIDPVLATTLGEVRKQQLRDLVRSGVQQSLSAYGALGFATPPTHLVTVFVTVGSSGFVASAAFSQTIRINPLDFSLEEIAKTLAHECFHLVQYWHTNGPSVTQFFGERDNWLIEGTAEWGRDVVYDGIPDQYNAPDIGRFSVPLNERGKTGVSSYLYETVVFWKWLEAKYSGALPQAFGTVRDQTRTVVTPFYRLPNDTPVSFNDTLRDTRADIDLMQFFEDVLYYKDFERDETGPGELWDKLGPQRDVEVSIRFGATVLPPSALATGGVALPVALSSTLAPSLTAAPKLIQNQPAPDALEGTIHVEFRPHANLNLAATVISRDTHEKKRVASLGQGGEVTFPFEEGTEIVVIAMDPQWKPPGTGTTTISYDVWVEPEESPCGKLPGTVHPVSTTVELLSAIEQASEGDTVLMAPGRYTVHTTSLPSLPLVRNGVWLIDKELTLAGSGPDLTEIVVPDTNGFMWAWDNPETTYRDFKVTTVGTSGFVVGGVERLSFCNVEAEFVQNAQYGVLVYTNWEGLPTTREINLIDSIFGGPDPGNFPTGLHLSSDGSQPAANLTLVTQNSLFNNWLYGIFYHAGAPNVTLDVDDCTLSFLDIGGFNVCMREAVRCAEQCPSTP